MGKYIEIDLDSGAGSETDQQQRSQSSQRRSRKGPDNHLRYRFYEVLTPDGVKLRNAVTDSGMTGIWACRSPGWQERYLVFYGPVKGNAPSDITGPLAAAGVRFIMIGAGEGGSDWWCDARCGNWRHHDSSGGGRPLKQVPAAVMPVLAAAVYAGELPESWLTGSRQQS